MKKNPTPKIKKVLALSTLALAEMSMTGKAVKAMEGHTLQHHESQLPTQQQMMADIAKKGRAIINAQQEEFKGLDDAIFLREGLIEKYGEGFDADTINVLYRLYNAEKDDKLAMYGAFDAILGTAIANVRLGDAVYDLSQRVQDIEALDPNVIGVLKESRIPLFNVMDSGEAIKKKLLAAAEKYKNYGSIAQKTLIPEGTRVPSKEYEYSPAEIQNIHLQEAIIGSKVLSDYNLEGAVTYAKKTLDILTKAQKDTLFNVLKEDSYSTYTRFDALVEAYTRKDVSAKDYEAIEKFLKDQKGSTINSLAKANVSLIDYFKAGEADRTKINQVLKKDPTLSTITKENNFIFGYLIQRLDTQYISTLLAKKQQAVASAIKP